MSKTKFKLSVNTDQTLRQWYTRAALIDMNPVYQRKGGIWSEREKSFLIDSILNGYDIPKVYLADFTYSEAPDLNPKSLDYAIIDGRQRFEAIFGFFGGSVKIADDFEYIADPNLELGGLGLAELRVNYPLIAQGFEDFHLTVVSVITNDEDRINELFVRLNSGKALTGAEIRNAMRGDLPDLVRALVTHGFFTNKIAFNTKRGQELNAAAKLLMIEFRGQLVDTKRKQLDGFAKDLDFEDDYSESREIEHFSEAASEIESADVERAAKRVRKNLSALCEVFSDRDPLLKSQGLIVLYYWLVRNHKDPKARSGMREFLVRFDERTAEAVKAANDGRPHDEALYMFNSLRRSINDQGALEKMYKILEKKLAAWPNGLRKKSTE